MKIIPKPEAGEYSPSAAAYIALVPDDGRVIEHMQENLKAVQEVITSFPAEKLTWRWAEGEWTVKEILVHIMDTERILGYRALRFARNDFSELSPFDQDAYVSHSNINEREIADILEEYTAVRQASIALFNSLAEETFTRAGVVNGKRVSVRALAAMICGHELHHLDSIRTNYVRSPG